MHTFGDFQPKSGKLYWSFDFRLSPIYSLALRAVLQCYFSICTVIFWSISQVFSPHLSAVMYNPYSTFHRYYTTIFRSSVFFSQLASLVDPPGFTWQVHLSIPLQMYYAQVLSIVHPVVHLMYIL